MVLTGVEVPMVIMGVLLGTWKNDKIHSFKKRIKVESWNGKIWAFQRVTIVQFYNEPIEHLLWKSRTLNRLNASNLGANGQISFDLHPCQVMVPKKHLCLCCELYPTSIYQFPVCKSNCSRIGIWTAKLAIF